MQDTILELDYAKLKKKFLELFRGLERNNIEVIGKFIEDMAKEFGVTEYKICQLLGNDSEIPISERSFRKYRKIYKGGMAQCGTQIADTEILEAIAGLPKEHQQLMIDRVIDENLSRNEVREEVKNLKEGIPPETKRDDTLTSVEMNIKWTQRITGLINELRDVRKTLHQFRVEKLFSNFTPRQRIGLASHLKTIEKEYKEFITEIKKNYEILESEKK